MKKFLSIVLALSLLFTFAACGKETDNTTEEITINPDDSLQEQINGVQNVISNIAEENQVSNIGSYETPSENDFVFESVDGGVKIVSYTGTAKTIKLPETLGGSNVVEIGQAAFNDVGVVAVKLPNTIEKVSDYAFYYCDTINEVVFGENITEVGEYAFAGCFSLRTVQFNNKLKSIKKQAFGFCSALTDVNFPNSIEQIVSGSFALSGLETLTIPGSVKVVEQSSFSSCSELKTITIEEGVAEIGSRAFETCSSLETVTIPSSVTEIESNAFQQCPNLTICAPAGSAAETYAATYEINFQAI